MAYWRIRLQLRSALATPLHSGTLFGHLCWAYRELHSDNSLISWLRGLPEDPFLISDAFPNGWLPKPMLPATARLTDPSKAKALKKQRYLPLAAFLSVRSAMSETQIAARTSGEEPAGAMAFNQRRAHNRIDRLTGTTPESGGLFFTEEYWPSGNRGHGIPDPSGVGECWDAYVSTSLPEAEVQSLFAHVGNSGFGKDAALGRGRFHVAVDPALKDLFSGQGNRWMSLSHGSLTANMTQPRYRLHTHYGKVGPMLANHRSPFKYPITVLEPGATFASATSGPFGDLLTDMHPDEDLKHIVHNAWHLALPFSEVNNA